VVEGTYERLLLTVLLYISTVIIAGEQ